jgi:hypothetical protein
MNKGVVGDDREALPPRKDRSREPSIDPFSKAMADRADARRASRRESRAIIADYRHLRPSAIANMRSPTRYAGRAAVLRFPPTVALKKSLTSWGWMRIAVRDDERLGLHGVFCVAERLTVEPIKEDRKLTGDAWLNIAVATPEGWL